MSGFGKRTLLALVAAILCLGMTAGAWAQSDQPSLAEIARRNRAEKAQKAKKVYTEDSLPKTAPISESSPAPGSVAAPSGGGEEGESAEAGDKPAVEAAAAKEGEELSPEAQEAKELAERLKADEQSLENNIKKLEEDMENATSDFRRELYRESLQRAQENREVFRQRREEAEKDAAAGGKKPEAEQPPQ